MARGHAAIPQLENGAYAYDPAGNITRSIDTQGGGSNVPVETQCYGYDALDQLTEPPTCMRSAGSSAS